MLRTMTGRAFNQDTGAAKRAAKEGPVFITDRGKPTLVLMSVEEYQRLTAQQPDILQLFGMPPGEYVEDFEPGRMGDSRATEVDLS